MDSMPSLQDQFTLSANLLSKLLQRIPKGNEERRLIFYCLGGVSTLINLLNFVFLSILALNAQHHVLEDINERFCLFGNVLIIRTCFSCHLLLEGLSHDSAVLSIPGVNYCQILGLRRLKHLIGRNLIQIKLGCIILRLKGSS